MNRFRTKKKAKDGHDIAADRAEIPAVPALKSSKTFRLGRKPVPEPERKLELDLANALPSSEDFRTSLLMSGLSARFSMLREQDDPSTKIGKASDDSVLFPKRQSRLHDLTFQPHGLHDIAEVSSIRTSIRPPFASGRVDSFHSVDSFGDDDRSVMGRSRPGEGNNLFGGRQKIYKIPASASGEGKSMGGRALYDDDVSQSSFQKLRQREREQRELEEREREDEADSPFPLRSNSPPPAGYNRNRETSSTTSSGPSLTRSSTAATSVTSQRAPSANGYSSPSTPAIPNQSSGVDRPMTKGKRLYETGLDLHLHSQQHSAITRIDTLSRQHNLGTRTPSPSFGSSAANGYENIHASGFSTHHITIRSASPSPTSGINGTFDFGVKASTPREIQKPVFTAPPLSPPMSDAEDQSILPIQPNDRGKATAAGVFAKPIQPYDEKKYTQRQLQMQRGRETPPPRKHSPSDAFNPNQQYSGRSRAESNATHSSGRSRSSSSAQRQYLPPGRNMPHPMLRSEASTPDLHQGRAQPYARVPYGGTPPIDRGQFEQDSSWIHSASPKPSGKVFRPQIATERPPESQHPAIRPRNEPSRLDEPAQPTPEGNGTAGRLAPPSKATVRSEKVQPADNDLVADSPTLGPPNGLSGLVRQHLRSDSNTSSVYGQPSPGITSKFPGSAPEPMPTMPDAYNSKGNPWDVDDWDLTPYDNTNETGNARRDPAMRYHSPAISSSPFPNSPRKQDPTHNAHGEDDVAQRHNRNGSSETQKERVEFANELASARRRVQENLKSFVESESRSASPGPSMDYEGDGRPPRGVLTPTLKSKPSRDSMTPKSRNGQTRAMKMLGINGAMASNSSSGGKQKTDENLWKQEEEEMLRGVVQGPRHLPPTKAFRQARRDAQRDRERQVIMRHQQAGGRSSGDSDEAVHNAVNMQLQQRSPRRERDPQPARRLPSQESKSSAVPTNQSGSRPPSRSTRDRSSSDASGRSKSHGRYRDDLAKAMAEGRGSSAQGIVEEEPSLSRALGRALAHGGSPIPSSPAAFSDARSRSNSRTGYFDSDLPQPIQTGFQMENAVSPRPSPIAPFAVNPTPALTHASPISSAVNTPTSQSFPTQRITANIKRIVNKSEISEPTLISKTSRMITIDLPEGASLQNGMYSAPPAVPPQDPRRRQTRTQTVFGSLMGKNNESTPNISKPVPNHYDEMSAFSADEADQKASFRPKIRKIESDGGNLNARNLQAFASTPSPAVPTFPVMKSAQGLMF